jgi:hypothetical protein
MRPIHDMITKPEFLAFVAKGQAAQAAATAAIERTVSAHQISNHHLITQAAPGSNPELDANTGPGAAGPSRKGVAKPRALNPTPFLCRSECRAFMLEFAAANRHQKFSRVSEEALREINEAVRSLMMAKVRRLPSKGKTI